MENLKRNLIRLAGKFGSSRASAAVRRACDGFASISGGQFQILTYHRVMPDAEPLAIDCITVADFEIQVTRLSAHFRVVPLDQAWRESRAGGLPPGTLCITFDDGYADNYLHAFPVLRKHGVPATIFLASSIIGTQDLLWHDRVLHAFRSMPSGKFAWEPAGIDGMEIAGERGRPEAAFRFLKWLKEFHPRERDGRIDELWRKADIRPPQGPPMMLDWEQVREMARDGISFGAHTATHPILSRLPAEQAEKEIEDSRRAIEEKLGTPCRIFAYPNGGPGDFNAETKAILSKLGFDCALTTRPGVNRSSQDPFELLRTRIWERNADQFHGRLLLERLLAA
jgi:peptidoglycan/xylan/chitin deacetylase (PgdA/CDA1 family)